MNYTIKIKLLALAGVCTIFSSFQFNQQKEENTSDPPNIIFLLADDMRHDDMSFVDPSRAVTPHLDKLASMGTIFTNGYVTTAICAVSRASILTGKYARRHGIYGFTTPLQGEAWQQTYPMELKKAGYKTGFVGKYGLNIWVPDEQKQYPSADFDYWFVPGPGTKLFLPDEKGRDAHYTRMLGNKALQFINDFQEGPFCLSLSFLAPHGSLKPNPDFEGDFDHKTVPLPPNFGDEYYAKLPAPFHGEESIFGRHNSLEKLNNYENLQDFLRIRMNKIYGLDLVVGKIILELQSLGIADNTIIVFSSDHGYYTGEHGLNGKWWMHEESVRVPMIIYDPRLPKGVAHKTMDEKVLNIDIAATLMDYAGVQPHESVQGRSMKPLVDGENINNWRDEFYFEQHFDLTSTKSPHRIPPVEGVVEERYKYMNYFKHGGAEELYDYLEDPFEKHNLVDDPAYTMALNRMREKYKQMKEELK